MNAREVLYRAARLAGDVNAVKPGRVGRRVKNRVLGRVLGRAGIWKALWR